ncbi:MAG: serine/threonine-protein kinase [Gemmataceae bacterium]
MAAGEPTSPEPSTSTAASDLPGDRTEAASRTRDHVAPPTPARPASFGPFQVLDQIGHGGMGIVYRARDPQLNRDVAVKQLSLGFTPHPMQLDRFATEARAVAALDHPNIVPILEFNLNAGQPYFVMKYLSGGSLAAKRAELAGDGRAVAALMAKVARAVQHAHDRRVLHRDLKPANILLDEHGEPLVGDFGLAKVLDDDSDLTYTGQVLGTPAYMAPEQRAGRTRDVGFPCDIWALGITIRELVTGQRAADSEGGADRTPRSTNTPAPAAGRFTLERGLQTIVNRCLQPRPEDRYPSAGALADDLEKWLRGEFKPPMSRGRRRFLLAGAGSILTLAGGATTAWVLRRPHEALARLQWDVEHEGKADLLTPTGGLRWQKALTPDLNMVVAQEDDEFVLTINSAKIGLLELMVGLKIDGARLNGQMRLENVPPPRGACFGPYAGRSLEESSAGAPHCFVCADVAGEANLAQTVMQLDLISTLPAGPTHNHLSENKRSTDPTAWHDVALELTGSYAAAGGGEEPFARASRSRLQNAVATLNAGGGKAAPPLAAGGWGLFVYRCRVSFRRLRISPVRENGRD